MILSLLRKNKDLQGSDTDAVAAHVASPSSVASLPVLHFGDAGLTLQGVVCATALPKHASHGRCISHLVCHFCLGWPLHCHYLVAFHNDLRALHLVLVHLVHGSVSLTSPFTMMQFHCYNANTNGFWVPWSFQIT